MKMSFCSVLQLLESSALFSRLCHNRIGHEVSGLFVELLDPCDHLIRRRTRADLGFDEPVGRQVEGHVLGPRVDGHWALLADGADYVKDLEKGWVGSRSEMYLTFGSFPFVN